MFSTATLLYCVIIGLAVAGFLLCCALCKTFVSLSVLPNHAEDRSSHSGSVPRAGGIAILTSFCAAALAALIVAGPGLAGGYGTLILMTGLMGLIGIFDDIFRLSALVKFLSQFVVAAALVAMAGPIESLPLPILGDVALGPAGFIVSVLWIGAFVNVFNFMDGLNGMAAGSGLVALLTMAVLNAVDGELGLFILCLMMASAVLAFFLFNYPGGTIFMGDGGSLGIGGFLAGLAILSARPEEGGMAAVPVILLPLAFLPFILDVSITLARRIAQGERFYEAHKTHFYQRLNQAGWSHADVTRLYLVATVCCAVAAWSLTRFVDPVWQWAGVAAMAAMLLGGARLISQRYSLPAVTVDATADGREEPAAAE